MSLALNFSQSGVLKSNFGKLKGFVINSHSSGTLKIYDGLEGGAPAVSTLTSTGALAAATHAISELVSSGAMVAGTHPVSVLTGNLIVATNVVVVGTRTYTFVARLSANPTVADEVLVGSDDTASLLNLKNAINGSVAAGTIGNTYSQGTVANTQVVAVSSNATTVTVRGRVPGTSLNSVATTGTALRTVWADTTLGGGTGASDPGVTTGAATVTIGSITYTVVDALSETYGATAIPYQVLKGASEATMLDNLKLAINGTGTAGTEYSTGTVAHADVVATTNTNTVQTVRARVPGTTPNTIATTETMANTAWADTTLGGGTGNSDAGITTANATFTIGTRTYTFVVELSESLGAAAIADQILYVTDVATALDNMKKAINASGVAGTDYSTGTLRNTDVKATTNTDTTQVIEALTVGTAGNSIATTETIANHAWTSTVMASGTGSNTRVMFNTMTFGAGERFVDLGNCSFNNGLYVTVGGTLDATMLID